MGTRRRRRLGETITWPRSTRGARPRPRLAKRPTTSKPFEPHRLAYVSDCSATFADQLWVSGPRAGLDWTSDAGFDHLPTCNPACCAWPCLTQPPGKSLWEVLV